LFDRKRLATFLETAVKKRRSGGRRHHPIVHRFAALALRLCDVWHEENIRQGVNDRGRRADMKDEAAKIVFEKEMREMARVGSRVSWEPAQMRRQLELPANFEAARETIRDLMDRPTTRLKSRT
jgi:hypothetical protein